MLLTKDNFQAAVEAAATVIYRGGTGDRAHRHGLRLAGQRRKRKSD